VEDVGDRVLRLEPAGAVLPGGVDVAGRAPQVADVTGPQPRLVGAPLADAEDDRAAGGAQGVAHGLVRGARVLGVRLAPVVFQIVDAPGRVLARVLVFVAAAARPAAAGQPPGVGIDAELQAPGMDV